MFNNIKNKIINDGGLIKSLLVHATLFLISLLSVSMCHFKRPAEEVFVTIDMLPIIDKSNVENASTAKHNKDKPINDKPKPEPKVEEEKKPEKKPDPKPKDEPKPQKDNPDALKKPDKQEKPIKEKEKKVDPKAKKDDKKKEKDQPKKKKTLDDLIDKAAEDENPEKISKTTSKGKFDPSKGLGLSVIDSIKNQITNKWLGPKNRETIIHIKLDINGELIGEPVISSQIDSNDPLFVAVAQAAKKAIMRATPFKDLPKDQYDGWKELKFTFLAQE